MLARNWWKILAVILVLYAIIGGFMVEVPELAILNETIRNLFFHVTMWFSMIFLFTVSLVSSIRYLSKGKMVSDIFAKEAVNTGLLFGVLGLITGSIWAKFTWGDWWTNDVKLNGSAISMLIYLAYVLLRNSLEDEQKRARVASVYNIFAFVLMIVFLGVLPRLTDSLHPGNGGNPAFSAYDLDNDMKFVFYPAVIGWILLGVWIMNIRIRLSNIRQKLLNE